MQDEEFEWDDGKAESNLAKHDVNFEQARHVFSDMNAVERIDDRMDYGEERFLATGMVEGRLIAVSHTIREGRIRIISARKGTRREQNEYYRQAQ